jgi:integrase
MARRPIPLNVRKIETFRTPSTMHGDGAGLYFRVTATGTRNWVLRYQLGGRRRDLGLGRYPTIGLADARERAHAARRLIADGIDPVDQRAGKAAERKTASAKAVTFEDAARAYIAAHRGAWSTKHATEWPATLERFAFPAIGALSVAAIDVGLVLRVIEPLWNTKTETASRVRGRIELVLDWARARGYRGGDNPARWRGHLDAILPAPSKVAKVTHYAAMPYAQLPTFLERLRTSDSIGAACTEFIVLMACRLGEAIGASWAEIDRDNRIWIIPAERMKGRREHRVPLSDQAMAVLDRMAAVRHSEHVFPSPAKLGAALSSLGVTRAAARAGAGDYTLHGFRSAFRDWCAEATNTPSEVAEMALAHAVGNKVEAAYRRGNLFEKRRELAAAWGRYCDGGAAVVELRSVG